MGGQYNRNNNNPGPAQAPRVFDQGNRTEDLPVLPMGEPFTRVSDYRTFIAGLPNRENLLRDERSMTDAFAMILTLSEIPVYQFTLRGETFRVVNNHDFDPLYQQYRNDPAVQIMANSFVTNPQYRQQIMTGPNGQPNPAMLVVNALADYRQMNQPQANQQLNPQGNNPNLNNQNPGVNNNPNNQNLGVNNNPNNQNPGVNNNLNNQNPGVQNAGQPQPARVLDYPLNVNNLPQYNSEHDFAEATRVVNQIRAFALDQDSHTNPNVVRSNITRVLVLSQMPVYRVENANHEMVPVYDEVEFNRRYQELVNSPAVNTMTQEFLNSPERRAEILNGPGNQPSADAMIAHISARHAEVLAAQAQPQPQAQQEEDDDDEEEQFVFQENFVDPQDAPANPNPANIGADWVIGDEVDAFEANLNDADINQRVQNQENQRQNRLHPQENVPQNQPAANNQAPEDDDDEEDEFHFEGQDIEEQLQNQQQNVNQEQAEILPYHPEDPHNPPRVLDEIENPFILPPHDHPGNVQNAAADIRSIRNFAQNQAAWQDRQQTRENFARILALSQMQAYRRRIGGQYVVGYDSQEFNRRYNQLVNDPAVGLMATEFNINEERRQRLLGGDAPSVDTMIANTVMRYRSYRGLENEEAGLSPMQPRQQDQPQPEVQPQGQDQPQPEVQPQGQNQPRPEANPQGQNQPRHLNVGNMTYAQFMDAVRNNAARRPANEPIDEGTVLNMMAAFMQNNGRPNDPVDLNNMNILMRELQRTEAFQAMIREDNAEVKQMLLQGDAAGIVQKMAAKETEINERDRRYMRPAGQEKNDAGFMQEVMRSVDTKTHRKKAPSSADKRNPEYKEMMSKVKHIHRLNSGNPPRPASGTQVKELIESAKQYINKGTDIPGGPIGEKPVSGLKEALCILKRYMPDAEFRTYCESLNTTHHSQAIDPDSFIPGRLNGLAVTGDELLKERKKEVQKKFSAETLADVLAVWLVAKKGTAGIVQRSEVEKMKEALLQPGSAYQRMLAEPESKKLLQEMASSGNMKNLADTAAVISTNHAVHSAQGQLNKAARSLTNGPVNTYFASKSLSAAIAAYQMAQQAAPGQVITNRAFREKAEEIETSPHFKSLLQHYMTDAEYRNKINASLSGPRATGMELALDYSGLNARARFNRNPIRQPQPGAHPVPQNRVEQEQQQRQRAEEQARQNQVNQEINDRNLIRQWAGFNPAEMNPNTGAKVLHSNVPIENLPNADFGDFSLADPVTNTINNFIYQDQAVYQNKREVKRIIAGALACSVTPAARKNVDGEEMRVFDTDRFNTVYGQLMQHPEVERMAERFVQNPQYRASLMQNSQGFVDSGAMVANISKNFAAGLNQPNLQNNQPRL